MEESKKSVSTVSLLDLWVVLRRYWLILLATALLASGGTALYLYQSHVDVYSAKATLWVLRETQKEYTETSDVSIANNLIFDVAETIVSNDVLEAVRDTTGTQRSVSALYNMIRIAEIPDTTPTHIVHFTVSSTDPEEARALAEAFVLCTCDKMEELFNGEKYVKPYDSVSTPGSPSNPVRNLYIPIFGLVAAAVLYVVFLLLHLWDGRIDTEDSLNRELDVILLGEIPNIADAKRANKKGGRYSTYYAAKKEDKKKK